MKKLVLTLVAVCLTVMLTVPVFSAAPYVAYWSFDENANEEINGYTPANPSDLTLADGKSGKAYGGAGEEKTGMVYFDDLDIPITDNFTAAAWVKGDFDVENGGYFVMMAKNPKATDGHFEFYWFPDGTFGVYGTNASEACALKSSGPLDDGEWHHFCVRVENSTYMLYVDGELDHTQEGTPLNIASGPLYFGSLVDETLACQSYVDDMFITDTLIPEADIAKLMSDTKSYAYELAGKGASAEVPAEPETAAPAEVSVTPAVTAPASTASVTTAPSTFDSATVIVILAVCAGFTAVIAKLAVKRREI